MVIPDLFRYSRIIWGFSCGPVVKNPPSNAGDMSLIPDHGTEIPHAAGQLSLCAATTEEVCLQMQRPRALEPGCHHKREACTAPRSLAATTRQKPAHLLNKGPLCCN